MAKSLVIYDSAFGNTKLIAEAIAKKIGADILKVSEIKVRDINKYDNIVVGSPIQGWRPLPPITEFIASLKPDTLKGKRVIAFDTRINIFIHGDAVKKIAKGLEGAGAQVLDTNFFYVKDKEGPIVEGELERAVSWADNILAAGD